MALATKRFLVGCFALFCSLQAAAQQSPLDKLIFLKKGYVQNSYPPALGVFNFTVLDPGVAIVPVGGGIYMAGLKKWFLPPSKTNLPFAVDYCQPDSTLYIFAFNNAKSFLLKSVRDESQQPFKKVLEMPKGIYGIRVVSKKSMWIWGKKGEKWCVWKYDSVKLSPVFESSSPINDLVVVNDKVVAIATNKSILKLGANHAPEEIIKMDAEIDGLAISSEGTLYVSTNKGILHYIEPELAEDAEVITYGIHGKITRYRNNLYVLSRENNEVLRIKL
ncbi:hypothetical protein JAO73_15365 [Hymenobacter sp. BT523]|uniref:hypothetical protein n=1 Tax=Hymenobacter sp. BT523 TaxID=2795725 RepID=UPI0018EA36FD|nr:hypothetical protein [Hymenobacter sp. BT523]MBJ6110402.1 hypothetical protein [Hymenobacter sp. BT523]